MASPTARRPVLRTRAVLRAHVALGVVALALTGVAGCSGGGADIDPDEALATAAAKLDETAGARLALSTSDFPDGATGVVEAIGDATSAPAFEGDLVVRLAGQQVPVPVIATDGRVWATLPFQTGFTEIDPADYDAPDPAQLLTTENGVGALLAATSGAEQGEDVRGGEKNDEVLRTVTGTVPGDVMARVIPTSADDEFEVTYRVTADGELREVEMTGVFYDGTPEMTYDLLITDLGLDRTIEAP